MNYTSEFRMPSGSGDRLHLSAEAVAEFWSGQEGSQRERLRHLLGCGPCLDSLRSVAAAPLEPASGSSDRRSERAAAGSRLAIQDLWREGRRVEVLLAAVDLMLNLVSRESRLAMEDLVGLRELRELMTPAEFPVAWRRPAWAVQFGLACLLGSEPTAGEVIVQLADFIERWGSAPEALFEPLGRETPLRSWQDLGEGERGLVVREAGLASEISAREASEVAQEDLEWLGWWSAIKLGAGIEEARA